jgi:SAM-dependent methyltransferase
MNKRKHKPEWFDNDAYWRETFPFMFPKERMEIAAETVEKVLGITGIRGGSALDLCCGPGRCSLPLASHGFAVTGVDRSKFFLDKARASARSAKLKIEWIQSDMRNFVREDAFNLVLSMFTSFGYFEDRDEDLLILNNIFRSLRPGGAFLMEVLGKEILARMLQDSSVSTLPDGTTLFEQRKIIDDWSRVVTDWNIIRKGKARKFTIRLNLYSGQELREKLELAGFSNVKLMGTIDRAPYDSQAKRLIALAWKPTD